MNIVVKLVLNWRILFSLFLHAFNNSIKCNTCTNSLVKALFDRILNHWNAYWYIISACFQWLSKDLLFSDHAAIWINGKAHFRSFFFFWFYILIMFTLLPIKI